VDAAYSRNNPPGTVFRFDVHKDTIPTGLFTRLSTHAYSVPDTIDLARAIDQIPSFLVIYGIECANLDIGTELSPEVREAADKLIEEILQML
jgi:hydrogenase maturation protease